MIDAEVIPVTRKRYRVWEPGKKRAIESEERGYHVQIPIVIGLEQAGDICRVTARQVLRFAAVVNQVIKFRRCRRSRRFNHQFRAVRYEPHKGYSQSRLVRSIQARTNARKEFRSGMVWAPRYKAKKIRHHRRGRLAE